MTLLVVATLGMLVLYFVRRTSADIRAVRELFDEAVRRGLLSSNPVTHKSLGPFREPAQLEQVEDDASGTIPVTKVTARALSESAVAAQCGSPVVMGSSTRCTGTADPRCRGGSCSVHCQVYCPKGCRDVTAANLSKAR